MAKKNKKVTSEKRQSNNGMSANKKYKDTVFRRLFSERDNLLSLYNAVNGTAYTDPSELEIVTLESAIYMGMKMTWHLSSIRIYSCMSISQLTTPTCRYGICCTYQRSTRNW